MYVSEKAQICEQIKRWPTKDISTGVFRRKSRIYQKVRVAEEALFARNIRMRWPVLRDAPAARRAYLSYSYMWRQGDSGERSHKQKKKVTLWK